jgi:CheY-like chemotaxis protein
MAKKIEELSILYVEDDFINRKLALAVLERLGMKNIQTAENGYEAIEKYSSGNFDIILMDIQMPEMDGFDATKKIRELEKETGTHTPIIALTAYLFNEEDSRYKEAGMDLYLYKPFVPDDLKAAISKVIE